MEAQPRQEIPILEASELICSENPPLLIDCREQHEYDFCRIEGAVLVPLSSFSGRAEALIQHADKEVLIYCHHGVRSLYAVQYLAEHGFHNALSIEGGIDLWSLKIDSTIPRY